MALPTLTAPNTINCATSATFNVNTLAAGGSTVINTIPTNHVYRINAVIASNKTASAATVTLSLNRNTTSWYSLVYQMSVPGNSTAVLVSKDAPIYMMDVTSDLLSASVSTASAMDIIVSYDDIT